ncbi:MAG: (2Fe-2S) ferredoxin domain-containing protein [Jaaginema sp. PMC 1079.18]|nr:(2Fe-2S) ferredoxin domain-containing protein [Jaaginema sp. PMC 1080.18]MEC4851155.1 (2Fe-2S) ferredoxin domain-containing protein [Jaaginema sp. PMC 1079.18]MEC4866702.1 (2Fe-2S) ferredoxin domain-containing protein [Jaaginema sp. PMC 1078.18]
MPRQIFLCQNSSCRDRGAKAVLAAFRQADLPADVTVVASGCLGQCNMGPTARVLPDETWYCRLTPDDVKTIVVEHLQQGNPVEAKLHPRIHRKYSF